MTLGERLDLFKGRGPGFDNIRVSLALAILIFHSIIIVEDNNDELYESIYRGFIVFLLPAFFALSGFLVAGSVFRTGSIKTFVTFRILRILPALAVEIALSALLLGPIVTTFILSEYFSDKDFFLYFTNIFGMIRYTLPGVFVDQGGVVNVSLWTIPVEIYCYIFLVILMFTKLVYKNILLVPMFVAMTAVVYVYNLFYSSLNPVLPFPTRLLLLFFFAGIIIYKFRYSIPCNLGLGIAGLLVGIALMYRLDTVYLSPIFIAYGISAIGLYKIPNYPLMNKGDYSYGIYLYAWPIQMTVMQYWPTLDNWVIHCLISMAITIIFAALSWHIVEKPVLKLKERFKEAKTVPVAGGEEAKDIAAIEPTNTMKA